MEAALLTMIAALFVAVLGSIYEQRRDGAKTREKLDENTDALRELAARTTILEASHQHLIQAFTEHRRIPRRTSPRSPEVLPTPESGWPASKATWASACLHPTRPRTSDTAPST